jgi:2-polyprenyl-3-methyl-5-hydroxy-6-metoxy-1,4-benzoquinol methylase
MERENQALPTLGAEPAASTLPFEPVEAFRGSLENEAELADCLGKRIGILIVTFNAVGTLAKVLRRISPHVWGNVEEIAVFDDASQDATYELAVGLKAVARLPKLTVLKHPANLGYGGNQKAGYRYFIDRGFDIVVLLHGDGQYAPEILASLYHPLVTGEADAVFGSRMMKAYGGSLKGGMPLYKYVGNRILSTFENAALGLRLTEFHSGYRAYSLDALRQIDFTHMTDDFHFDTEIIIKLHHQNFHILETPIPTYYGQEICYVNGMKYAGNVVRAVWRYKRTSRSSVCFPEFREYFVRYPIKRSRYSSHDYARRMVGTSQDVLDIGCGEGHFALELADHGNRITGVDALPEAAHAGAFRRYFSVELEEGLDTVIKALQGERFGRILLLDVLEHLRGSARILNQCHELLDPQGLVIVSLPNVANITVRAMLLFGRFNYTERGILDKTHVRFFTRKTARAFVEKQGFRIAAEKATVMPLELVFGLSPDSLLMRIVNRTLALATAVLPGLLGYQFVFALRSKR